MKPRTWGPRRRPKVISAHRQDCRRSAAARRRRDSSRLRIPERERRFRGGLRGGRHRVHRPSGSRDPADGIEDRGAQAGDRRGSAGGARHRVGYRQFGRTPEELAAQRSGYPVLLKASAGGGGKGMRRVDREARSRSGDPRCFERSCARLSATAKSISRNWCWSRATSRFKCWATATAT